MLMPTELPHSSCVPLSILLSWKEYFDLPSNLFSPVINADSQAVEDDQEVQKIWRLLKLATESSSFILTILAGWNQPSLTWQVALA